MRGERLSLWPGVLAWAVLVAVGHRSGRPSDPPPIDGPADLRPAVEALLPERVAGEVVVLRLAGPVQRPNVHDVGNAISASEVDLMLEVAIDREPAAIVLAIDSPGGLISEMDRIIDRLVEVQSKPPNRRIVAWVDLGASAAALIALSCKEIVMRPHGRIGAATAVLANGEEAPPPADAVDQKIEAMRQARRRQIASLTRRPLALQEAMEFPKQKLWAHEQLGFSAKEPRGEGWEALDASTDRPLALDAASMVRFKLAEGTAGDVDELLDVLRLPAETPTVTIDLGDDAIQEVLQPTKRVAIQFGKRIDAFEQKLRRTLNQVILAIRVNRGIAADDDGYVAEDVRRLLVAIRSCKVPAVDVATRKALVEHESPLLEIYDRNLRDAKEMLARAARSISVNAETLPVAAIDRDLDLARQNLLEALEASSR